MAKTCPQCKSENPNTANFCMICNTKLLAEDEQMSETDQLHAELAEAKEKIAELRKNKKALEKSNSDLLLANETLKNNDKDLAQKIVALNQQIADKDKQISNINAQLAVAKKKKSNSAWIVFLVLLSIGLLIATIVNVSETENWKHKYYSKIENNRSQQDEIDNLKNENQELENQNNDLKNEKSNLETQIYNLQSQMPKRYKTIYSNTFCYNFDVCSGNYTKANCGYGYSGAIVTIYKQEKGYGLTSEGGWCLMSYLEKAE